MVFLKVNLGTGGALYAALKRAVADGDLNYDGGMWHFTEPRGGAVVEKDAAGEYYRSLFMEFKTGAKGLLPWLVCHPAPLMIDELADVSGLDALGIEDAAVGGQVREHFFAVGIFGSAVGNVHILIGDFISESA